VELPDLKVLHWRGAQIAGTGAAAVPFLDRFQIDTCQRRVVVCGRDRAAAVQRDLPADGALESFEGTDAYAFLLRFACGLESKLVAETAIFGQIKQAWHEFSESGSPLVRQLSPWVQLLFQDVKSVRAQHLGKLGSASYGSQVRRLLGEQANAGPTLLIGAGQLAQGVAPWLTGSELWLCNRTTDRARELAVELAKREPARPVRVIESDLQAELAVWRTARQIIVCIPGDEIRDQARVSAWRERGERAGSVIHLGLCTDKNSVWQDLPQLLSLGTLFDMLKSQSELRHRQLERARRACREKALLRALGANASHPHSWEDLAAFDSL
jgi:hypothetical protein